tara:strand:- start:149 stop:925 length:777 start_codon:yes stop_codon:yes gene_type:complete
MAKNLSFPNNESVSNFYSKIQIKVQEDLKENIIPYQYKEFYDFFKKFKSELNLDAKIADIGCGYLGGFLPEIKKYNFNNLFATDLNPDTVKNIKEKYNFINISQGDCTKLNYRDNEFDFLICYGVIHHTHDYQACLKELSRILKPGQKLFLGVYSFDNCLFEYIVRFIRLLGKFAKFDFMFNVAKRIPLFNRFYMDHAYVPVLYLINRKEIIETSLKNNLHLIQEFASRSDFFQKIPFLGRMISGNGLLRIFIFQKKN